MKEIFKIGDRISVDHVVSDNDVAAFKGVTVHNVCSTYALAREMEWSSRQFVLKMKEEDEEGIGTHLTIDHKGPAFVGELIKIEAEIIEWNDNELICAIIAKVKNRIVATGKTGQKVLKKTAIKEIFSKFGHNE
ncbi:MAG TPA: hypothetical protein PKL31_05315 [Fulvivirga sp.]|nr:hypothetical protein [Fulvivirga sp.]